MKVYNAILKTIRRHEAEKGREPQTIELTPDQYRELCMETEDQMFYNSATKQVGGMEIMGKVENTLIFVHFPNGVALDPKDLD